MDHQTRGAASSDRATLPAGDASHAPSPGEAGRRELKSSLGVLAASLVALVLAARGSFSSMWFFPHVFGGIMALLALLSLRHARSVLWVPRLAVALLVVAVAVLLPRVHIAGARAQLEAYESELSSALVGREAAALAYHRGVGGEALTGSGRVDLDGEVTLLNFWAIWCGPCVREIPLLEDFWQAEKEAGIRVVGVTKYYEEDGSEEEAEEIRLFMAERGASYPVIIAEYDSQAHRDYGVTSLPSTILVDGSGRIVDVGAGIGGTERLMERARELAGP